MASLSPAPKFYEHDASGAPLVGGFVHTYVAGTVTPAVTYTDSTGNTQNTNPVELDASGRANIWLSDSVLYKFVVTEADGSSVYTVDYIAPPMSAVSLAASSGSALIGFIQAGSGAVARTAQAKMREVITSADFGDLKGTLNTGLGVSALEDVTAASEGNSAFGYWALRNVTSGEFNNAFGYGAGSNITTGINNTLIGVNAGTSITSGEANIAVGGGALAAVTDGLQNTAVGLESLNACTGDANVAVGDAAMRLSADVVANTIVGAQAAAGVTGNNFNSNSGLGYHVFEAVVGGTVATSVAVGREALKILTSGSDNVAIGAFAANTLTSGSNVICIGRDAEPTTATTSNEVTLGNSSITLTRLRGAVQIRGYNAGEWTTPAFSAANFTANNSMTWTVESGDVLTYAYCIVGKMMTVSFYIITSTIGGTPSTLLLIAIPAGRTSTKLMTSVGYGNDNGGANEMTAISVTAGGTLIRVGLMDGSSWAGGSNNNSVYGQITFEID